MRCFPRFVKHTGGCVQVYVVVRDAVLGNKVEEIQPAGSSKPTLPRDEAGAFPLQY